METNTNAREIFVRNRAKFAGLFERIKAIHHEIVVAGRDVNGHGFDHDVMVAQYAAMISENERVAEMAWVAGLMHSLDRHFPDSFNAKIEECIVLVGHLFSVAEIEEIRVADRVHSRLNDPLDGPVTIALKDADRLANVGALNIIRGGQHRPNIPACVMESLGGLNPASTFKRPASCYDATFYNLEWWDMLRSEKARDLGRADFEYTRAWQRSVEAKFAQVGLFPWKT
ncbi:MAG: hypothetical protein EXS46_00620 [Candidatus Taylorbacteria bacterium]|nr:hypothetical protein [Candidatus Taylorbacteria bacterium]